MIFECGVCGKSVTVRLMPSGSWRWMLECRDKERRLVVGVLLPTFAKAEARYNKMLCDHSMKSDEQPGVAV